MQREKDQRFGQWGSLSERVTVQIGGIPQGMFIQSVDPTNPVLLFVHGGPGMTEFFMETTYPTGLERHFTMVWWEQRGAGMSFSGEIPPETMTMDQMIADTGLYTLLLLQKARSCLNFAGSRFRSFSPVSVVFGTGNPPEHPLPVDLRLRPNVFFING